MLRDRAEYRRCKRLVEEAKQRRLHQRSSVDAPFDEETGGYRTREGSHNNHHDDQRRGGPLALDIPAAEGGELEI
jgi:hypothetical protein